MKILLCGARGFVGRHLQRALLRAGHQVVGGVSQQQGGDSSLTFASQHGPVALDRLTAVPLTDQKGDKTAAPAAESE